LVPYNGETLEVAAGVRKAGEELVFFIHGLGCSKESFHHFWNRTEFTIYSAVAIDLVGHGDSVKSDDFSYTLKDQARVCSKLLRGFSAKRLHIVAHSMGGAVALLLDDDLLQSVKSFVNIEGNLIGADCGMISRKIAKTSFERLETEILPKLYEKTAGLEKGYAAIDFTSAKAMYQSAKSLVAWSDTEKLLGTFLGLRCLKSYFYGERNARLPILKRLDNISKIEINNSGHFSMLDNPDGFYDALNSVHP